MKSQEQLILEYLQQGNSITQLEALNMFGDLRLSDRIFKLKAKGHNIDKVMVPVAKRKRVAAYFIVD